MICSLYSDKNLKCSNLARKVELSIILKSIILLGVYIYMYRMIRVVHILLEYLVTVCILLE